MRLVHRAFRRQEARPPELLSHFLSLIPYKKAPKREKVKLPSETRPAHMTTRQRSRTAAGSQRNSEASSACTTRRATIAAWSMLQRECQVNHVAVALLPDGQAAVLKHIEHGSVFGKHIGFELRDASLPRQRGEMPQD